MFGLSAAVIDEVMRQSPYAPRPAGMVKNDHVAADGASYAIYWRKDVTATLVAKPQLWAIDPHEAIRKMRVDVAAKAVGE